MLCHADVEVHGAPHTQHRAGSSSRTGCGPRHGGAAANAGADAPPTATNISYLAVEAVEQFEEYMDKVATIQKELNDSRDSLSVEDRRRLGKRVKLLWRMAKSVKQFCV